MQFGCCKGVDRASKNVTRSCDLLFGRIQTLSEDGGLTSAILVDFAKAAVAGFEAVSSNTVIQTLSEFLLLNFSETERCLVQLLVVAKACLDSRWCWTSDGPDSDTF